MTLDEVESEELFNLVLDRCGFIEDGALSADWSAHNQLAHERADAVMVFLEMAALSNMPRKLLPKTDDFKERNTAHAE